MSYVKMLNIALCASLEENEPAKAVADMNKVSMKVVRVFMKRLEKSGELFKK